MQRGPIPPVVHQPARFDVLDFYRYAGALFIAFDHFLFLYLPVPSDLKSTINTAVQPLMGFFFTLSGFVIMHVYDGRISNAVEYLDYLQRRLARIYPLHLVTLLLAIIWGTFSTGTYLFTSDAIVPNILLIHAWGAVDHLSFNYPSWSVSAEMFVYLLFPFFLLAINRLGLWGALLLPVVLGVGVMLLFKTCDLGLWTDANYNFGCLRAAPSFVAGMAIYRVATKSGANLRVPQWLAHGLAISTLPIMFVIPADAVLGLYVLVVFCLARCEPASPGQLSKPLFRALANCSYGFYMWHALIGAILLSYIPKALSVGDGWKFVLAPAAIVATTVISVLSYRFFENPARRYLSGSWTTPIKSLRRTSSLA